MKTLIVLFALAATAIAAPAAQTSFAPNLLIAAQDKLQTPIKREKKSPVPALSDDITTDVENFPPFPPFLRTEVDSAPETLARTFSKKPIIVKKKHGYHLYRDSDEEQAAQADSQEKCMKEVKVKLCDATGFVKVDEDKARSSTVEDIDEQVSNNDMEQSIKMAKEAVESLQRGFKNIDHGTGAKMTQWKHSESGSDAEMHQDIEIARQALEHIQKNFGNLESMNLHAATLKDAEALKDAHSKIVKMSNEEERMSQWKEAMDNIQKNVEIAKNLEDSFKSSSPSSDVSDSSKTTKHLEHKEAVHESSIKSTDVKPEKVQTDMEASASEPKESKIEFHDNVKKEKMLRSDVIPAKFAKEATVKTEELSNNALEKTNEEQIKQGKSSELNLPLSTFATPMQNKHAELEKENKMNFSEKTEKILDTEMAKPVPNMKSNEALEKNAELDKHDAVKEWKKDSIAKNTEQEKSAWKDIDHNILVKSNENIAAIEEKTKLDSKPKMVLEKNSVDTTSLMKSVEHMDQNSQFQKSAVNMDGDAHFKTMKTADLVGHESQQINHVLPLHPNIADHHVETNMKMKSAEHDNEHLSPMAQAQNVNLHSEKMPTLKEAEKFNNEFHNIQMERKTNFAEQNLPTTHENMMAHAKSANMDSSMMSTMQMNMKDAVGKSALERNNMMQWKHDHGAARGAYGAYGAGAGAGGLHIGAGAGGGSGAVGVFPNANVGGCAIPLLLSCSPSVVSGSLTKHHGPAYAAPGAYRSGEGLKFHSKRELLKDSKILASKVKRTPATRIIQTIPVGKNL